LYANFKAVLSGKMSWGKQDLTGFGARHSLFIPQRLDRLEPGRPIGWINPEENPRRRREAKRQQNLNNGLCRPS